MTDPSPQIVPCPAEHINEAVALVLRDVDVEQRQEISSVLLEGPPSPGVVAGLIVAVRQESLCGAAWGQLQPGSTAVFWPPQLAAGEPRETALRLAEAVVQALDASGVDMIQVLLSPDEKQTTQLLAATGFRPLTELVYLAATARPLAAPAPPEDGLEFETYDESQRGRLIALVEQTYEQSQDCATLTGARRMDDVIDGYRATGSFRPENWLFVRNGNSDVGVLLLAEHPPAKHWELVYVGLVPAARGRGWGGRVTCCALDLAHRAGAERLVLAVDATNRPAVAMYNKLGFVVWDRRKIWVRFRETAHS